MHNHSYENKFNLHVNEISFSCEKMGTKTRFEEEATGNSEMPYLLSILQRDQMIPIVGFLERVLIFCLVTAGRPID